MNGQLNSRKAVNNRRWWGLIPLLVLALILLWAAGSAIAQEPQGEVTTAATMPLKINYQGQLSGASGAVSVTFSFYEVATSGTALWTETKSIAPDSSGLFTTQLGDTTALSADLFNNQALWLGIKVGSDPEMTPRQEVTAVPYAMYAASTGALHGRQVATSAPTAGQVLGWDGSQWGPVTVSGGAGGDITAVYAGTGLTGGGSSGSVTLTVVFSGTGTAATVARSDHNHAGEDITSGTVADARIVATIARDSEITPTVWANDGTGSDLDADLLDGQHASAFAGVSHNHWGQSWSGSGIGLMLSSSDSHGVYGLAGTESGYTPAQVAGVWGDSQSGYGVYGSSYGSGSHGVHGVSSSGVGGYFQSVSGNIIEAWDSSPSLNRRFVVSNTGDVAADGSITGGGADFAEMLPAMEGLEPGDVLVIDSDGQLVRSTSPYATSVVGVHSTKPGFIGRSDEEMENLIKVPLAIMGIVPCKASAENGPITPGDLLTTSSTPGHAMRAGDDPPQGAILGKALERLKESTGVIKILVTLQ